MSSEHKKPLLAFAVIALACAVFMGYTVRAHAIIGVGERANPLSIATNVLRIGDAQTVQKADPDTGERGAATVDDRPDDARQAPGETRTAEPKARPGFGKKDKQRAARKVVATARGSVTRKPVRRERPATSHRGSHRERNAQSRSAHRSNRSHHSHRDRSRRPAPSYSNRSHRSHSNRSHRPHSNRSHSNRSGSNRSHRSHSNRSHGNRSHRR